MGSRELSDTELVSMILLGDRQMNRAIEYILSKHAKIITDYLVKQNCGKEDAEDILYEGISIFIMNVRASKFQSDSTIRTYITGICKRIWFKKFNKKLLHKKWEKSELEKIEPFYLENGTLSEFSEGIQLLMTNLKERCKEVLHLWALSYNMKEIGDKLGYKSTQVVMNKKNLCLKELRKQLIDNPKLMDLLA